MLLIFWIKLKTQKFRKMEKLYTIKQEFVNGGEHLYTFVYKGSELLAGFFYYEHAELFLTAINQEQLVNA